MYEVPHIYFIDKEHLELYLEKALTTALRQLQHTENQYISFCKNHKQYTIPMEEILYMERVVRITEIHTATGIYTTSLKIPELIQDLSSQFAVCHRSYIVNLAAIEFVNHRQIVLTNGQEIPVSRSHSAEVKRRFSKFVPTQP